MKIASNLLESLEAHCICYSSMTGSFGPRVPVLRYIRHLNNSHIYVDSASGSEGELHFTTGMRSGIRSGSKRVPSVAKVESLGLRVPGSVGSALVLGIVDYRIDDNI